MVLASGKSYAPIDMAMDKYEEGTVRLFERLLEPGMGVVDVGAHVGFFTLIAARLVGPTGRVYAFEPEPLNYALLSANIQKNGYSNILAVQKALANSSGPRQLFISSLDNGSHSLYRGRGRQGKETLPIEATTLDAFLATQEWPRVALVKIDVEGAELSVLEGMSRLLGGSHVPRLIIEFCPYLLEFAGRNPLELIGKLASLGFKVHFIDDQECPTPVQEVNLDMMIARLTRPQTYVNLFCSRTE
jgi:FkbM family methyltransferase